MYKSPWLLGVSIAALLAVFVAVVLNTSWSLEGALVWLQKAPPVYVVIAVLIAPLFGAPLSPLLTTLTIIFPFWTAFWIANLTIISHHLLVWLMMQSPAAAWLRVKMQQKRLLPPARDNNSLSENLLFIFATAWIPGVSYIFKPVYLLLSGISTKVFFIFGSLSQLVAALPYLLLGQAAGSGHLIWFSIALFLVFALAWVLKRYFVARKLSMEAGGEK